VEAYDKRNTARTHAVLRAVAEVAERLGRPMAHVALAWLVSRPGVASILLGARNVEQLMGNLDATGFVLEEDDLVALTEASAPRLPDYPYGFVRDWSGVDHWERFGL
jgi:aryl-alcohol dehydrogenase-like predicted oxidoreductase